MNATTETRQGARDFYLSLNRCPIHTDFMAVMLDYRYANGNGRGTRLTPSKCCGKWETIKQWKLKPRDLAEIAETFSNASEEEPT